MKQITLVLHYEDDAEAEEIYQILRYTQQRDTPEEMHIIAIRCGSDSIRMLKLQGPHDSAERWNRE